VTRVLVDGIVEDLSGLPPATTVLQWLRGSGRTGTKEGCAEGDCGACTVALGEADGSGGVRYRAVNSCILFIGSLDGKELVTVEHLHDGEKLHPVQQAMVATHASQCGFCTPGFVMSLFCLYHARNGALDDETIHDTLAGNLCRCTGYRPIVDAARQMQAVGARDKFHARAGATCASLARLRRRKNLAEIEGALAEHPDAVPVAGATDVGLWVTKQNRKIGPVLLEGIDELGGIAESEGEIDIGAGVTYTDALPAVAKHWPSFGELLRRLGSVQVRNCGTIGGNIANASPIGDTMPALMTLGTRLVLRRQGQRREVPLGAFFLGYRKTALQPGELIERIRIPIDPAWRFGTWKVAKRRDQDISAVAAGCAVRLESGRVAEARLAFGGMAAVPKRAAAAEAAFLGKAWSRGALDEAMAALERDFAPLDDMRGSAGYRSLVAKNLLRRFFDA
jgi:xanthine dehydrogenase small subunit